MGQMLPKESVFKLLMSHLTITVPLIQDKFLQQIHSLKTIIKQHFVYWMANNVSFYPLFSYKDFT